MSNKLQNMFSNSVVARAIRSEHDHCERNAKASTVYVRGQDIAERLARAFQQAAAYCGQMKKADPF